MPFVAIECCGSQQEDFVFPDEVQGFAPLKGRCSVCGETREGKTLMSLSAGTRPLAAYGGKNVFEVDKQFAEYGGAVRHLERGTAEHRRHVNEMREISEQRAKEAGYSDRRGMRRAVRSRRNNASQGGR